ncbi:MAG: hypothetical protein ACKO37_05965 [Vampirovibrionales bacterium]
MTAKMVMNHSEAYPAQWEWLSASHLPIHYSTAPSKHGLPWMITPALLNAHTHLDYTLCEEARALAPHAFPHSSDSLLEGQRFSTTPNMARWLLWLVTEYLPAWRASTHSLSEAHLTERTVLGALKALSTYGVGTIADIARSATVLETLLTHAPKTLHAWVSFEAIGVGDPSHSLSPLLKGWLHTWEKACHIWEHASATHQASILLGLSPHSAYNVSQATWQWLIEQAKLTLPYRHPPLALHTHGLESESEWQLFTHGPDALEEEPFNLPQFHRNVLGFPTPNTMWTWGNTATDPFWERSIERCHKRTGVTHSLVAHGVYDTHGLLHPSTHTPGRAWVVCPRSNVWLQGKTLSLRPEWLETSHLPFNFGTDSLLSTPTLDPREEARFLRTWWQEHPSPETQGATVSYHALWRALTQATPALKAILPQTPAPLVAWYWDATVSVQERHQINAHCLRAFEANNPEVFAMYLLDPRLICTPPRSHTP